MSCLFHDLMFTFSSFRRMTNKNHSVNYVPQMTQKEVQPFCNTFAQSSEQIGQSTGLNVSVTIDASKNRTSSNGGFLV